MDDATTNRGWSVAASIATLFIEGTAYERHELDASAPARPQPPLEEHPLAKHYGLPVECLALTKAHRSVEGEHRQAAWRVMLNHVPVDDRVAVVQPWHRRWMHGSHTGTTWPKPAASAGMSCR